MHGSDCFDCSTRAEGVRARLEVRAAGADSSAHIVLYEGDRMITNELELSNSCQKIMIFCGIVQKANVQKQFEQVLGSLYYLYCSIFCC